MEIISLEGVEIWPKIPGEGKVAVLFAPSAGIAGVEKTLSSVCSLVMTINW